MLTLLDWKYLAHIKHSFSGKYPYYNSPRQEVLSVSTGFESAEKLARPSDVPRSLHGIRKPVQVDDVKKQFFFHFQSNSNKQYEHDQEIHYYLQSNNSPINLCSNWTKDKIEESVNMFSLNGFEMHHQDQPSHQVKSISISEFQS